MDQDVPETTRTSRPAAKQIARRGGGAGRGRKLAASAAASKKRKPCLDDLKDQIQKQGDELINFIDEQLKNNSNATCQKPTLDEELASIAPVLPWITSPTVSSQSTTLPAHLHEKTLEELYKIIESYEKLNMQATGIKKPTWMRWEQDGKELTELNEHAMGFAARNVSSTVMPGLNGSLSKLPPGACDIQKMAWEMVEDGRPKKGEETWGMAAQGQVKVFTDILKMLPPEK